MTKRLMLALAMATCVLCSCDRKQAVSPAEHLDTIPVLTMHIQQCSRLYTAEYMVHKIVTHSDKLQIDGSIIHKDFNFDLPLGKRKIAIPIDASVKAYVDFEEFSEKDIKIDGENIEITLPDPKIALTSTRIDHQAIKQYVAITRSRFSDEELTLYEQRGRESIIEDIPHMGIIETARQSAASILVPMIKEMGFEEQHITVSFRKHFGIRDIPSLLDTSIRERYGTATK
ncbi:MAG: DUF4230 domain-containing protein [Prevotella sp.]|nr:DUF4230 domain-containing protein [Prevotella sp.]